MATTTVNTAEDLLALLARLGRSSADVAAALEEAGITGYRDDPGCCPVANWLLGQVPEAKPDVSNDNVALEWPDGTHLEATSPCAVAFFVADFDNNQYPELDRDGDDY